jgi:hypothetical protein
LQYYGPATAHRDCASPVPHFFHYRQPCIFGPKSVPARAAGRLFVPPVPQECSVGRGGPLWAFVHGAIDVEGPQQVPNLDQGFQIVNRAVQHPTPPWPTTPPKLPITAPSLPWRMRGTLVGVWGCWTCDITALLPHIAPVHLPCPIFFTMGIGIFCPKSVPANLRPARAASRLFVPPVPRQCSVGHGGPL